MYTNGYNEGSFRLPKLTMKGCFLMKEFLDNKDRKANRLINEKSPYLLQHAYNPVDWYAWGEEAFKGKTQL
jgi:hypothetical protein